MTLTGREPAYPPWPHSACLPEGLAGGCAPSDPRRSPPAAAARRTPYGRSPEAGFRKGVERRFQAAENPFADQLAAGLFGIAAQGRDAAVAGGSHAVPAPDALPGTDHVGRPPCGGADVLRGSGGAPRPEVFVKRKHIWLLGDPQILRARGRRPAAHPPGSHGACPGSMIAPLGAGAGSDRPSHAYAPSWKTVSRPRRGSPSRGIPGRRNPHDVTVRGPFRSVSTTAETAMSNGFQSRPKGEPAPASGASIATVRLVLDVVGPDRVRGVGG